MGLAEVAFMSSPFTTPDVQNFFDTTTRNEIILAYSERRQALGQAAVSPETDGGDAVDASGSDTSFATMQGWLLVNSGSFVPLHASGDYDGETDIKTIAELAVAAGQSLDQYFCETICAGTTLANGFRYVATSGGSPLNPASYSRVATGGDYSGTHLIEDLHAGFSKLGAVKGTEGWSANGTTNYRYGQSSSFVEIVFNPDTTDDAEANEITASSNNQPLSYTRGEGQSGDDTTFLAEYYARSAYATVNLSSVFNNATVDIYAKVDNAENADSNTFDDNGSGLTEDATHFAWLDTFNAGSSFPKISTTLIGNNDMPAWCSEPAADSSESLGWTLAEVQFVIILDFTNG